MELESIVQGHTAELESHDARINDNFNRSLDNHDAIFDTLGVNRIEANHSEIITNINNIHANELRIIDLEPGGIHNYLSWIEEMQWRAPIKFDIFKQTPNIDVLEVINVATGQQNVPDDFRSAVKIATTVGHGIKFVKTGVYKLEFFWKHSNYVTPVIGKVVEFFAEFVHSNQTSPPITVNPMDDIIGLQFDSSTAKETTDVWDTDWQSHNILNDLQKQRGLRYFCHHKNVTGYTLNNHSVIMHYKFDANDILYTRVKGNLEWELDGYCVVSLLYSY